MDKIGDLRRKVASAPQLPGCYLYRDAEERVIYVGKAKNLRSRTKQYFHKSSLDDERVAKLVPMIRDVEYLVTATERDALLAEYALIQRYRPWFNRQMNRRKQRAYLRIDKTGEYPAVRIVEVQDGADAAYYGPFRDVYKAQAALETLNEALHTPLCQGRGRGGKACLHQELGQCCAPCVRQVSPEGYDRIIESAHRLLRGETDAVFQIVAARRDAYASSLRFEKAQASQALLEKLERLRRFGKRIQRPPKDSSFFILFRAYREPACTVFFVGQECVRWRVEVEGKEAVVDIRPQHRINVTEGEQLLQALGEVSGECVYLPLPGGPVWDGAEEDRLRQEIQWFLA